MVDIYASHPKKKEKEESVQENVPSLKETDLRQTKNPFSAFAVHPRAICFEGQEKKEEVILLLRKHWITNLGWLILAVLFFFAPLILPFFPLIAFLPSNFQFMAIVLWYLLLTAFIFEQFLSWYFNVYLVTDRKIVDIDFHNLLYKEIATAELDKIQDVTYKMGGVIRTLFGYGDVFIQTAGTEPNFDFLAVPRPSQVVPFIRGLKAKREQKLFKGRL